MGGIAISIYLRQLQGGIQRRAGCRRRGWVYLGILEIWVVSFLSTLGDFLGLMGEYRWNGTVYGCDAVYDGTKNWIHPSIVFLNFLVMGKHFQDITKIYIHPGVCYSWMYCKLRSWAKFAKHNENLSDLRMTQAHMKIPVVLSVTYAICILPNMVAAWGIFPHIQDSKGEHLENHKAFENITTAIFWCMFGKWNNS